MRLVGHWQCELDITSLDIELENMAKTMTVWSLPVAVRQALALTFAGLTLEQLAELVPIFGITLDRNQLRRELKRLDGQHRINFTNNRATASEAQFDFRRRARQGVHAWA